MRSFLPEIGGYRPWRAVGRYDPVRHRYDEQGWFATTRRIPLADRRPATSGSGRIHWGKVRGWLPAWIDSIRLAWQHRLEATG